MPTLVLAHPPKRGVVGRRLRAERRALDFVDSTFVRLALDGKVRAIDESLFGENFPLRRACSEPIFESDRAVV